MRGFNADQTTKKNLHISRRGTSRIRLASGGRKKKRNKEKKKGQFYECHMLAQLIRNEVMIRKVFR